MNLYLQAHAPAFNELYERHAGKILGYLKKKVSPETAEDLLQEIFTRLHTKKQTYNDNYLFLPWIFTIARNTLLDHYKKAEQKVATNSDELTEDLTNTPSHETSVSTEVTNAF